MVKIAVVEDEKIYTDCLDQYLRQYMGEHKIKLDLSFFEDGEDILENYRSDFDIIFMDIKMRFKDGMSTAEEIRKADKNVMIIFITNMVEYAIRGYAVDALDYVLKPIKYFTFSQKLDKALENIRSNRAHYVSIPIRNGVQKIDIHALYYIESQGHALIYHATDATYHSRGNMADVEALLKPHEFFRSNKGYLVNMEHVNAVKDGCCVIHDEMLTIARARRKAFMETLANHMSGVMK